MRRAMTYSRKELRECVSMYLDTPKSFSKCAEQYGVSPGTFIEIVERAIVERVASDKEVDAIAKKAEKNCFEYGGKEAAIKTESKYARLRAKRLAYVLPDEKKAKYTALYAMEDDFNLKEFSRDYLIPWDMMVDAIECSIKDNLIDDKTLRWLTSNIVDDESAGEILTNLDHLIDIRENTPKKPRQMSLFDT